MSSQLVKVEFEVSGTDRERLVVVGDDLTYLMGLPRDRLLSHTEVRLAAGILRRLLIDRQLAAVWRPIGEAARSEPLVEATEIDSALSKWPRRWIRYAWAGGASTSVAHHTGFVLGSVPKEEHERYASVEELLEANPLPLSGEKRRMTVETWLGSTSVAIQTNELGLVSISRRSVLKYIANRKGGVHFGAGRGDLALAGKRKRQAQIEHHLLDHGLLRVGHLSGPEYEVASMARVVASSEWASQLVQVAREAAPDEFFGDPYELKFWTGMQEADGTGWATSRMQPGPEPAVDHESSK